jgi:hypothetical protein
MQNGSASPPDPRSVHNYEPLRNSPYLSQTSLPRQNSSCKWRVESPWKATSRNFVLQVYEAGIRIRPLWNVVRSVPKSNQFYDELMIS